MFGNSLNVLDIVAGVGAVSGPAITWMKPALFVFLGIYVAFIVVWSIVDTYKRGIAMDETIKKAEKVIKGGHWE